MSTRLRAVAVWSARPLLAAAGGVATYTSFPPLGWWAAAVVGVAALVGALAPWGPDPGPRARTGALTGLAFGLGLFLPLLNWVGLYVGDYASWGLALVESFYTAAFGAGAAVILRLSHARAQGRGHARLRGAGPCLAAVGVACWWSVCEWIRSSWPWGGFPWGALAFGQADGPLVPVAGLVGADTLGTLVAVLGAGLGVTATTVAARRRGELAPEAGAEPGAGTAALAAPTVLALVLALVGATLAALTTGDDPTGTDRTVRVALVQGNVPRLGLDFAAQRRVVLDNHLRQTALLADRVEAGAEPRPDFVIWPENAADVSPLGDARAAAQISDLSTRLGAPVLVGTVVPTGHDREATNTMLVWDGGNGVVDRHDKHFIQPFGEWLPWRPLFEKLFPIARTAGRFVPGDDDGTVDMAGVPMGVATCYEIAFDAAATGPVRRGAQLLTVPTNNATFGRSPMTWQQLGMSRVRAVEHHIPVLVAATSGVSAVVDRDGSVRAHSEIFEPTVLTADVPVEGAGTLATRLGGAVAALVRLLGLCALAGGLVLARRRRGPDPRRQENE